MTSTDASSNGGGGSAAAILALLGRGAADPAAFESGYGGLQFDVVTAPLDVCCGVFGELARVGGPVPPMARLGDTMLFLVRVGSTASALACPSTSAGCASLGVEMAGVARPLSAVGTASPEIRTWVVPPPDGIGDLPPASTVIAAIKVAYASTRQREGAL